MKTFITYFTILVLSSSLNAQTIKLDYKPKGTVVKFFCDSLTIFTDATSLFCVSSNYGKQRNREYDLRVKNLVLQQIMENQNDTVSFSGKYVPFNDGINSEFADGWYVNWTILHLIKKNKLIIFDKNYQLISTILIKRIGSKKKGSITQTYINKETNEELFNELLYFSLGCPPF